jgi:hypothetical protein
MLFREFYQLITGSIRPAVETFTGTKAPEYDSEYSKNFLDRGLLTWLGGFPPTPLYSYMVYLRHHGFPSPLNDWSHSPYVAAFFAFRNDQVGNPEKRSIYAYCESPEGMKGGAVGEPTIRAIGPYVTSDRRHFRQQSDYMICGRFDENYGWRFDSHEYVFEHPRPSRVFFGGSISYLGSG